LADGPEKAAIAQRLFGKQSQTLLPLLNGGSEALQEQLGLAEKYGAVLDDDVKDSAFKMLAAEREMNLAWFGLRVQLGSKLLPILSKVIQTIAAFVSEVRTGAGVGGKLRDIINQITERGQLFIEWLLHGEGFAKQLRDSLNQTIKTLRGIYDWGKKNTDVLLALTAAVAAGYVAWKAYLIISRVLTFVKVGITLFKAWRAGTLAATAAQLGLNTAMIANPIGIVIAAIAALVAGIVVAYKKVDWFREGVNRAWSWIKDHWPLLVGILTGPFGAAAALISKNWDTIKEGAQAVLDWLIKRVNDVIKLINGVIDGYNKLPLAPNIGKIGYISTSEDSVSSNPPPRGGASSTSGRGRRLSPGPLTLAPAFSSPFGGDINLNNTLELDGKVVAKNQVRQSRKKKATR
jgi:hypothetical protein